MFEFRVEWQEAPGVRDPLIASTWARLELWIAGKPALQLLDSRASSVRTGVYGSVLPLAEWIIESWWSLLHEPVHHAAVFEGARRVFDKNPARYHDWLRRHNLLASCEGNALPDLSMFRDEDKIFVRWVPDPMPDARSDRQTRRFIGEGSERLPPDEVRRGLAALVDSVLERLSEEENQEVAEICANWQAVLHSEKEEPGLCQALAALGEDPYDPEGVDESLVELIETRVNTLAPSLREDLIEATTARTLRAGYEHMSTFAGTLGPAGAGTRPSLRDQAGPQSPWAHRDGYVRAERVRKMFGLAPDAPIPDLPGLIEDRFGSFQRLSVAAPPGSSPIDGLVGNDARGIHAVVMEQKSRPDAARFLLARALHHWLFTLEDGDRRLLTRAHGWEQRASRAFAAELLAPAAAIQRRLDEEPDIDETTLAEEMDVSPRVIGHQMENHGLL